MKSNEIKLLRVTGFDCFAGLEDVIKRISEQVADAAWQEVQRQKSAGEAREIVCLGEVAQDNGQTVRVSVSLLPPQLVQTIADRN